MWRVEGGVKKAFGFLQVALFLKLSLRASATSPSNLRPIPFFFFPAFEFHFVLQRLLGHDIHQVVFNIIIRPIIV